MENEEKQKEFMRHTIGNVMDPRLRSYRRLVLALGAKLGLSLEDIALELFAGGIEGLIQLGLNKEILHAMIDNEERTH